jgi:hypothetical protein
MTFAMNYRVAQEEFARSLLAASSKVNFYFWRLSGDEPNSLCRFLGMEEEELKVVLRVCKIYIGEADNISKNNFEMVMGLSQCDFTTFRLNSKVERFILVGKEGEVMLPKDMYDDNGTLLSYPVEDEHIKNVRTKSQRGSLPNLVNVGNKQAASDAAMDYSPKAVVLNYILELVGDSAKNGEAKLLAPANRKLERMMAAYIDVAAKDILHSALEKFALQNDKYNSEMADGKCNALVSPEKATSSTTALVSPPLRQVLVGNEVGDTPATDYDADDAFDNDDELTVASTVVDNFILDMKEEVVLQNLLHKRIYDKKERVFQLEHRNGRRLLVVLPPDTRSISSFVEEATKTNWVDIMLNSEERIEGMLTHLAKSYPNQYIRCRQRRDLSMKTVSLDTAQTIALARIGKLNDFRMKKIKSYLRQVGNVNLEMSAKEILCIDTQVA